MAKKSAKANSKTDDIWSDEQLAEQPSRTSKSVGLSERWVRTIRLYTKVSVWAFPVVAVVVLSLWTGTNAVVPKDTKAIVNQVDTAGKAAAILELNQWLQSTPSPLSGGSIVSWNGYNTKAKQTVPDKLSRTVTNPDYSIEIHHFSLVDGQGVTYLSDVAVAVDSVNGTSALGTPSLEPQAPAATGWATSGTWYGLQKAQTSDAMTVAIDQWAKAFTSGDPAVLRSIVGDPNPKHSYIPLVGVTGVTANFVAAGSTPVIVQGVVSDKPAKTVIAQVQLQLTWADANANSQTDAKGDSLITFDLLIQKADTAVPVVVAWGGPGSGTTLAPYDQAVIDRNVTKG